MDINKIQHLLKKYQENSCTEDECLLVNKWLNESLNEEHIQNDDNDIETNLRTIKRSIDRKINLKCSKISEDTKIRDSSLRYSVELLDGAFLVKKNYGLLKLHIIKTLKDLYFNIY